MIRGQRVAAKPLMDGRTVKFTLEQIRGQDGALVRLDWLRFTLPLDAVVRGDASLPQDLSVLDVMDKRGRDLIRQARAADTEAEYCGAMAVARSGAIALAKLLPGFEVGPVEDKGMDYYAARCPLIYEGETVAHVLAGGKSSNQASTVHFNMHGSACLFISHEKWQGIRQWIERSRGYITRVDLACDVFEGDDITKVRDAYLSGEFDVNGKRPSQTEHGSWTSGHSRTFEVGKRQTGKCMRSYEKGDEQFGHEENSPWIRYEVEVRNSARVIDTQVLERPADFFAGAYPFCEALLERLGQQAEAEKIKTSTRVQDATAEAAVSRKLRWFERVCIPTVNVALRNPGETLEKLLDRNAHRVPASLLGFASEKIRSAFEKVGEALAPAPSPSMNGA